MAKEKSKKHILSNLKVVGAFILLLLNKNFSLRTNIINYTIEQTCVPLPPTAPLYPTFDPSQLRDLTNFKFVRNNKTVCSSASSSSPPRRRLVLVMIHSARENTKFRNVTRATWASSRYPNDRWTSRGIFLLGEGNPSRNLNETQLLEEERLIEEEDQAWGDIVMGNFVDSYRNLTYKHLMGYKWVLNYCQNVDFVFKADDDFFLDLPYILNMIEVDEVVEKPPINMWCIVVNNQKANRENGSKWQLSLEEYPDETYPPYCYGGMYGVTLDILYKVYSIHQRARFVWVDDLFVTGIVQQKALEEYNGTLTITKRSVWKEKYTTGAYKDYCDQLKWNGTRPIGATVMVPRNEHSERYVRCLWKITNLERERKGKCQNGTFTFEVSLL